MGRANPKAWFTSPIAKITYKSVDKHARYQERWRPFFPTWAEAHAWMLEKAAARLKKAQAELKNATASHARIKAMTPPAAAQAAAQQNGESNG